MYDLLHARKMAIFEPANSVEVKDFEMAIDVTKEVLSQKCITCP